LRGDFPKNPFLRYALLAYQTAYLKTRIRWIHMRCLPETGNAEKAVKYINGREALAFQSCRRMSMKAISTSAG
jgi:DNA polymerase III alpha subunit